MTDPQVEYREITFAPDCSIVRIVPVTPTEPKYEPGVSLLIVADEPPSQPSPPATKPAVDKAVKLVKRNSLIFKPKSN